MRKEIFELAGWRGELYPECGANLCRLKHLETGADILRQPHDEAAFLKEPELYGLPVLFPPNRIDNGQFRFEGRDYCLPVNEKESGTHINGFLSRVPWHFSQDANQIICSCEFPGNDGWPHRFTAKLCYEFEADRVIQTLTVRNLSNTRMPFMAGFHSSFLLPDTAELFITTADTAIPLTNDRKLPCFPEQRIDSALRHALTFPQGIPLCVHARTASCDGFRGMKMYRDDISLAYRIDDRYGYWMIWNRTGSERFICISPQTSLADAVNQDAKGYTAGLRALEPNSESGLRSVLSVI